jgi:hypothetical protein
MARPPTYHMSVTVSPSGRADLIHAGWCGGR